MSKIDQYQHFIHQSRYARWRTEERRRETWEETVQRYCAFFKAPKDIQQAIIDMDVMPSMRALWSAGPALARNHAAAYNCAFVRYDAPESFGELMFVLMSGCGPGFTIEPTYIDLPVVPDLVESDACIIVEDSREGWATATVEFIKQLYSGSIPSWDVSLLRPKGARLETSGGRSSGPDPLVVLFRFLVFTFKGASGQDRELTSLEVHDISCVIGAITLSGGLRRAALVSLSALIDDAMRFAKHGDWFEKAPYRARSNNSAVYEGRPSRKQFDEEWRALLDSKSGERGIYNRAAARAKALLLGRDPSLILGINPCGEILLRAFEFCNLSEVILRPHDSFCDIKRKVEHATILGTLQSTLTDFTYLRPIWKKNCEEERLLGVSLTGIMDRALIPKEELRRLRAHAHAVNKEWAGRLGITPSLAITTVKPSGTVSQLVNSSSGIHSRFSAFYIRRVRQASQDPLTRLLIDQGVPYELEAGNPDGRVFEFPQKSPEEAVLAGARSAIAQCETWAHYNDAWADHSVSCTIYYSEDEFQALGDWVWSNFDKITGLSFLPRSEHTYVQAPYEAISEEEYNRRVRDMPDIDWSELSRYEEEDNTVGAQTLACTGDKCEIN